jgi:hypothetical protein
MMSCESCTFARPRSRTSPGTRNRRLSKGWRT